MVGVAGVVFCINCQLLYLFFSCLYTSLSFSESCLFFPELGINGRGRLKGGKRYFHFQLFFSEKKHSRQFRA